MIEVLHRLLRLAPGGLCAREAPKIGDRAQAVRLLSPDVVPLFAALLALPLPDHILRSALAPQGQNKRPWKPCWHGCCGKREQQPVLFIVEDLHWLDPSTLEFLSLVVDQTVTMRLFALFTYRPIFRPTLGSTGAPDPSDSEPLTAPPGGAHDRAGGGGQGVAG